ncbi:MAG TPA: RtcB family protein [Planctomycetota bacterium]|nr:RtcB family protein [Planctomycetota bacterium]
MKVLNFGGADVRLWSAKLDEESRRILARLSRCEHIAAPLAVMPDVHASSNVCVGTVLVTESVVLPTAVGEDLGCGMYCARLNLDAQAFSRAHLQQLVGLLHDRVPAGRRTHSRPMSLPAEVSSPLSVRTLEHQRQWLGARHIGTLGGGNHFIELQRDGAGQMWLSVHSGSRGIGGAIASHHARAGHCWASQQWHTSRVLPSIRLDSTQAEAFWHDYAWAFEFARCNRRAMADAVCDVLSRFTNERIERSDELDVPHNLITREVVCGRSMVVHRKGAMPAHAGQRGLIPGSMGTASYIVEGLGNPLSYESCSHGAGRVMSRKEAHARITLERLRRELRDVVFLEDAQLTRALIEECPSAYKDIKEVLAQQADLVRPIQRLEPMAVVKGK